MQAQGDPSRSELSRAMAGDEAALRALVARLTPVIQARVARRLLRSRPLSASPRDIRSQVEDLTQEVFLSLFADDGRILRSWEPERGLGLESFVGLVAERQALSLLRTGKRSPWTEEPTAAEELERPAAAPGPEELYSSRERLGLLLDRLSERLSPLGSRLFELLYVRELGVEEVGRETGLGAAAIYAWRSRLRRLAGQVWAEVVSDPAPSPRSTSGGGP